MITFMFIVSMAIIAVTFFGSIYLSVVEYSQKDRVGSLVAAMFTLLIGISLILCYVY